MSAARQRSALVELRANLRARTRALRARLKRIPDREAEMAINRLIFCVAILGYLVLSYMLGFDPGGHTLLATITGISACFIFACALFLHQLSTLRASAPRRLIAIAGDMITLGAALIIGGEPLAIMYPLYLWTIFGNGFRFGLFFLRAATLAAVVSFAIVILLAPYWRSHWGLSTGLMLAIIMLPLYVGSLIRKLSEAKLVAEEASRAKTMFLASVSHELRTPLNAIIGLSGLLKLSSLSADQRDMSQTIHASARTLLRLINSVLDFSRIEAGQMPREIDDIDLHALLIDIRAMTAAQCIDKPLRVSLAIDPRIPSHVVADRRVIEEVLVNLAGNAAKFTASGYVLICVDLIERAGQSCRLRFSVQDSGIGIAENARERIFDRFTQADDSILNRFGGTGLGLAIAKQLVEGVGGTIGVDSTPGKGSKFWFDLDVQSSALAVPSEQSYAGIGAVILEQDEQDLAHLMAELARHGVTWRRTSKTDEFCRMVREQINSGRGRCLGLCASALLPASIEALQTIMADSEWSRVFSLIELVPAGATGGRPRHSPDVLMGVLPDDFQPSDLHNILRVSAACDTAAAVEDAASVRPVRSLSILVADDNRTNQKVIRKILQQHGHQVILADNGETALDILAEQAVDLVFMDVNMPELNGIEATKIYRFSTVGQDRREAVRIVGLTADVTPERERLCFQAGMDDVLNKPIEPSALLDYVARLAGRASSGEDAAIEPVQPSPAVSDPAAVESLDRRMMEELERLGGRDFVADLVSGFLNDAAQTLRHLHQAAQRHDVQEFRDQAHALRSGAANIGAQRIYSLCLSWRNVQAQELVEQGQAHLQKLQREFDALQVALGAQGTKSETDERPVLH